MRFLFRILPLLLYAFLAPTLLHADSFSFMYTQSDSDTPVGITSTGQVAYASTNMPSGLVFDNGTPCSVSVPGFYISLSRCNNGRYAFSATYNGPNNQQRFGTFEGGGSIIGLDQIAGESNTVLLLNSLGDVASIDGFREFDFVVLNLTSRASMTPEPSTFALLGSGLFGLVRLVRNRSRVQQIGQTHV